MGLTQRQNGFSGYLISRVKFFLKFHCIMSPVKKYDLIWNNR